MDTYWFVIGFLESVKPLRQRVPGPEQWPMKGLCFVVDWFICCCFCSCCCWGKRRLSGSLKTTMLIILCNISWELPEEMTCLRLNPHVYAIALLSSWLICSLKDLKYVPRYQGNLVALRDCWHVTFVWTLVCRKIKRGVKTCLDFTQEGYW